MARSADLLALQPVLRGTLPLVIDADRASDIEEALVLEREYGLTIAVSSASAVALMRCSLLLTFTTQRWISSHALFVAQIRIGLTLPLNQQDCWLCLLGCQACTLMTTPC